MEPGACDHVLIVTCDQEVSEDQEAAAAEADRTVAGSLRGQEEKTAQQLTHTQHRCSLQHTIHGWNTMTHTHRLTYWKTGFLFGLGVEGFRNSWHSADNNNNNGKYSCWLTDISQTHINVLHDHSTLSEGFCPMVADQYFIVYISSEPWTRQKCRNPFNCIPLSMILISTIYMKHQEWMKKWH